MTPELRRFIQPDTIVPQPGNPQALNRYSYCLNNPVRYTDPSGYDPLDREWEAEFRSQHHGRDPEWQDRLIRLFSIAFPNEWDSSAFYDAQGNYVEGSLEKVFVEDLPADRSWAAIPDALERMAGWYTDQERSEFNRDVGALFGGLPDRFDEPSTFRAVRHPNNPVHTWVNVHSGGAPSYVLGDDTDANIHHWGWGFAMGGAYGPGGAMINTFREASQLYQATPTWRSTADFLSTARNLHADVSIGNAGAGIGFALRIQGTGRIRQEWALYMW